MQGGEHLGGIGQKLSNWLDQEYDHTYLGALTDDNYRHIRLDLL